MSIIDLFKRRKSQEKSKMLERKRMSLDELQADLKFKTDRLAEEIIDLKTEIENLSRTLRVLVYLVTDKREIEDKDKKD